MRNGKEGTDNSATYESVAVPLGRDREIRTALRTHQSTGFITVPSEEKKYTLF